MAAQYRCHPGLDSAGAEGLADKVVGASFQAHQFVYLVRPGRDHDHVGLGEFAHPTANFDAIEIGKVEVQGHQVRAVFLDAHQRVGPGGGLKNGKTLHLERPAQQQSNVGVVIHNHCSQLSHGTTQTPAS